MASPYADPSLPDWASISLPDTWPDRLNLSQPGDLWQLARHALGLTRTPVQLPTGLPGAERIPKYILQEFHNLPNGNYSHRFTRGYITGFDRVMLGEISKSHGEIAKRLAQDPSIRAGSVLDAGCGGGGLAGALQRAGIAEVWGLDPSPYLLQHAAHDWPAVRFVQGVAEDSGFTDNRFNAITACFLLHEIPPRYLEHCIAEFARILTPGGLLAICEPSPLQVERSLPTLLHHYGWRGLYFHALAHFVYDPFLRAWHQQDVPALLAQHGFTLLQHDIGMPMRHLIARKNP
jgi:ubiquinone/menaquinone biosynthesis C-methylase UbiE